MDGFVLVFYKIPVTQRLVAAVEKGKYPGQATVVEKLYPSGHGSFKPDEIVAHENRKVIFQCLEAFKQFLVRTST
jgi:hypothetical protein